MRNETFKLVINLGNDAMQTREDIANALHEVADKIARLPGGYKGVILDDNGNKVGSWAVYL